MYNHAEYYLKDQSFKYMPLIPLESVDDFSGAAAFIYSGERAKIDLIVHSVDFTIAENDQVNAHLGDTYSSIFFGKKPMEMNIEASLPDSVENFGKTNLVNAYKNYFRVSAVAKLGVEPVFVCRGLRFSGPIARMVITEDSESCDTCSVVLTMLVMRLSAEGDKSSVVFDWTTTQDYSLIPDKDATAAALSQKNVSIDKVTSSYAGKPKLESTPVIPKE